MAIVLISLLIPVAAIVLIIYIGVRRRKLGKELNERKNENTQIIPLWKGLMFQIAPIIGVLMILFYFILKNESNFAIKGILGIIFWVIAIALVSVYRKSGFRFEKTNHTSFGYRLVAYQVKK